MNRNFSINLTNIVLMLIILTASFAVSILLQDVLDISEHITTVYVFAVFLVSLLTEGYFYGVLSTVLSILIINYAFTDPFYGIDFTATENILSAIVMLIVSLLTSTLTTKLKKWDKLKSDSEKEQMRANLLRAVSHDLRTPLTTIYGSSSLIIDNYEKLDDDRKKQIVMGIKEDSDWLIRMVENLLSITKIDSGNVELIKTPTVLEELIDSVILKFKKHYPDQNVELDIPEEMVVIPMDAILIEQVIINILENVICHTSGFSVMKLRVFVIGGKAIFEISDDGCGIASEKLDNIFNGYKDRKAENYDGQKRNAGIGLSVCATIIKAHGGTITAENAKQGGAIFRFSLAVEEADE